MKLDNEWDDILGSARKKIDFAEVMDTIASVCTRKKISVTINVNKDGWELDVSPWEPYRPICPNASRRWEEDDGK